MPGQRCETQQLFLPPRQFHSATAGRTKTKHSATGCCSLPLRLRLGKLLRLAKKVRESGRFRFDSEQRQTQLSISAKHDRTHCQHKVSLTSGRSPFRAWVLEATTELINFSSALHAALHSERPEVRTANGNNTMRRQTPCFRHRFALHFVPCRKPGD